MTFREFERLAFEYWDEIPEQYRHGIDGVRVLRRAKPHGELPDVYTLGECLTDAYPSDFGGPDTTRSSVVLYHGSFEKLARLDPDFDWEEELWETLTHELRHHLESLAAEDALEDVDYAADENFKRLEGEPFDPLFYRAGEALPAGDAVVRFEDGGVRFDAAPWYVEGDWFLEVEYPAKRPPSGRVRLDWQGASHAFELPSPEADVTFVVLADGFEPRAVEGYRMGEVCVVLVKRASFFGGALRGLLGRQTTTDEFEVRVTTSGETT